jgi:hypothetical protein
MIILVNTLKRCNASNVSALLAEDYNFSKYVKPFIKAI